MNLYNIGFGQKITTDVDSTAVDRGFTAHITLKTPSEQNITAVLSSTALKSDPQDIIQNITSPDVARNIRIKGNAAEITGDVVITGTNIADEVITETITLNGTKEVQGNKAFKTITKINLPPETHEGTDSVSIGTANKLGLPYLLELNTVLSAYRNKILEDKAPTVAVSKANIENNTVLLNSALNGSQIDIFLIV